MENTIPRFYEITRESVVHGTRSVDEIVPRFDTRNPVTGNAARDRIDVECAIGSAQGTLGVGSRYAWSDDGALTITSGTADASAEEWTLLITANPL